jgi:hypothetical protein
MKMNQQEEQYIHFETCIRSLNEAWRILHIIKQNKDNPLINPSFQFALIEYSKPYTDSRGYISKNHRLGQKYVPVKHRRLHNEILEARKHIHAHSDLTVEDAKVYVSNTEYGKYVGILKSKVYDTEKLAQIEDIIELIEQTLDKMYEEAEKLKEALPVNSSI